MPPNKDVVIKDTIRGDVKFNTNALGDFVILRSNGLPVYNFCVAIDDALMRITHVIRAVSPAMRLHFACSTPHDNGICQSRSHTGFTIITLLMQMMSLICAVSILMNPACISSATGVCGHALHGTEASGQ